MRVGIFGVGMVGGATAKVFEKLHELYLYDKYKAKYNTPAQLEQLARYAEVVFVCVPTPMKPSGQMDYTAVEDSLTALQQTVHSVGRNPESILIVIRSTAVSGTTDGFAKKYAFKFAFNPEFLREKHAVEDMEKTNRVVIGANEPASGDLLRKVYEPLFPNAEYLIVPAKTAEMIKYAANVFLASQIALANEIHNICTAVGVDYKTVKDAILLDERIGKNIEVPGHDGDFGFGGKCFPKDLNALIHLAREHWYRPYLLEEVWRLNERVRKNRDWLDIPGAVSSNTNFKKE